tara:strand:- start:7396 stop:7620 length:225 start_codon:yes stop_codon:yes gene_type:complete
MEDFWHQAFKQFPSLTLMVITMAWLVKTFLKHIAKITEDHSAAMKSIMEASTTALNKNTETLGSVREALRRQHH